MKGITDLVRNSDGINCIVRDIIQNPFGIDAIYQENFVRVEFSNGLYSDSWFHESLLRPLVKDKIKIRDFLNGIETRKQ